MTIEETYKDFVEQLERIYEAREANNITDWVFESAGMKRLERITNKLTELTPSSIELLNFKLQQLLEHKPVQYVLNEAWFYKMKLFVNENVLIPRPETEELVEWVVGDVRYEMYDVRNKRSGNLVHPASHIIHILDIGTGSGCIPIALKKEIPQSEIIAVDASPQAIEVAKQNAVNQKAQIEFLQYDFLDEKSWPSLPSFNIIISNPPYIPENEKSKLGKNVAAYEPHLALFVEDNDPFIFYKKIALFAPLHLKEDGKIFVEVHEEFANDVQDIFAQQQFKTAIKKDLYGRNRMIKIST